VTRTCEKPEPAGSLLHNPRSKNPTLMNNRSRSARETGIDVLVGFDEVSVTVASS
jgi:hypothetical protein